ncbi:hypothetical protein vBOeSunk162_40 [Oenococcus phage vB_OeS_unk162]|nr:hypothetical protein vBOeSunk162_40 [Oenococcus phage vB_OeS_unk162]QNO11553.1 hypothetical protein [Oenococcus phage Vinitor-27]
MTDFNDISVYANNILTDYELLGNKEFMNQVGHSIYKVYHELRSYWDLENQLGTASKLWHKTVLYSKLFQILIRVPAMEA